jgi:hypothetical protein
LEKLLKIAMGRKFLTEEVFPSENRDNDCLLPQFRKSVLREAKIKNKSKDRYKNFRTALNNKTWYTIRSN